jgi:carbonic anhydrase
MKLLSLALAISSLLSAVSIASVHADGGAAQEGEMSWGYRDNDPKMYGPAQWGKKNANCDGKRQSPIDISSTVASPTPRPVLFFNGKCHDFQLNQTEESYKASVQGGSCTVTKSDKVYSLAQFHMHAPSEHTLNGKVFDGEAHCVHSTGDGSALLVVGLFLEKKENAETNPWVASVWKSLGNVTEETPAYLKLHSYSKMLAATAAKGKVFNYAGSLTTPVCSEIVDWWVIQTPVQVSPADFDNFKSYMKKLSAANDGQTARPVQPLNGRTITAY